MKTVKVLLATLFISVVCVNAQTKTEIEPYVAFLKEKNMSAKDYVISMFANNDIVILCERHHQEITQYDLILEILKDPYFVENVSVVFTEVGSRILNPRLNSFLRDSTLSDQEMKKQIIDFQRQCIFSIWEASNFSYFIKNIHDINKNLAGDTKIRMYPTDVIYVEGEPTEEKVREMLLTRVKYRDFLLSSFIIANFNEMKKKNPAQKALVIMNYRHAYKEAVPNSYDNAGIYLVQEYPGKVANILINTYDVFKKQPLQAGKWDAAFQILDIENLGFDFRGSPFGKDKFDHWAFEYDKTYEMMFNGFVFYKPVEKFKLVTGLPGLMEDGFLDEAVLEAEMYSEVISEIKKQKNIPVDREMFKELNDTVVTNVPNLDSIKRRIKEWVELF